MTDDVMSDCVGGDYIIEKMPKNAEIGDTGDLEIHEGTQMNLYNAFCAPFEHFGLASSLSKSRRVQS